MLSGWRGLGLFAACHAIDEWFSLPSIPRGTGSDASVHRNPLAMERLLQGRWSDMWQAFRSKSHFKEVKGAVTGRLAELAAEYANKPVPAILFHEMSARIEELDLEMSVILHMVEQDAADRSYTVTKFVVDESAGCLTASANLLTVFCHAAFGKLPECIRILDLCTGESHLTYPDHVALTKASDYIGLLADMYKVSGEAGPAAGGASASTGTLHLM